MSEPIEEQNFIMGVKVVNIGDVRVSRGLSRRHHSSCPHPTLTYDTAERRIWCKDCESDVEAFDAFLILVTYFDRAEKGIARRQTALIEAETFQVRSLAAKAIDEAWRKRDSIPCCPHCHAGLFPEDFKNGRMSTMGREFAEARRSPPPASRG